MVLAGGRPGLRRAGCEPVLLEGFLDPPGGGGADALVDRECLLQVDRGLAGVTVVEVAVASPFQCARFVQGRADASGDGQRLAVVVAGVAGG